MRRNCVPLVVLAALALSVLVAATPASAARVDLEFTVLRVEDGKVAVAVRKGEFKGKWSLTLTKGADSSAVKAGQSGHILASREVLKSRGGQVGVRFKGSDEELQALIDWLGSLEAQERR